MIFQRQIFVPSKAVKRDADGIAHIVSLSGGKDSVCMALALKEREPRPYTYVFTPTGDELPEMVAHMDCVESLIGERLTKLTNGTLSTVCRENGMLPNFHARFCTRLLKIKPFGKFIEMAQPAISYVGLRDDESEREGTQPGGDSAAIGTRVHHDFPLQRWGWGIEEVLGFLAERKIVIPERTDCARCPYQKLGEWYNLWLRHPDIYEDAVQDEIEFGHTFRSPGRDSWPASLLDLRQKFEIGEIPERSLRMMDKRKNMCRRCSL